MASLKRKRNDIENKMEFSKKFRVGLPCEKKLRICVNETLSFLIRLRPLASKYDFGAICNQLMRCSTSVSANLCEGRGRSSYPSLICFVSIARGSLFETFDHLTSIFSILDTLSREFSYSGEKKEEQIIQKMITLLQHVRDLWSDIEKEFREDWDTLLRESLHVIKDNPDQGPDGSPDGSPDVEPLTIHISEKLN